MSFEPNINRTVDAAPRLLCHLRFKIAPAPENTQGSRDSKSTLPARREMGRTEARFRSTFSPARSLSSTPTSIKSGETAPAVGDTAQSYVRCAGNQRRGRADQNIGIGRLSLHRRSDRLDLIKLRRPAVHLPVSGDQRTARPQVGLDGSLRRLARRRLIRRPRELRQIEQQRRDEEARNRPNPVNF